MGSDVSVLTLACMSLSGGQGKTTTSILLSRYLAAAGFSVLTIDADPQGNLTTFLGHELADDQPTLLEVLKGSVELVDAIYETNYPELTLIPADDGLDTAQDFLSSSGMGVLLLGRRLEPADENFDVCIIDSPPQRSQICKTIIGAAHQIIIPCEASVKGYGSLVRTLDAISEITEARASQATLFGALPFRDRWVGANQTTQSRDCIEAMSEAVGQDKMLPSVRESERYKTAASEAKTLHELGYPDLAYPFEVMVKLISRGIEA